jgi:hypothetical protein
LRLGFTLEATGGSLLAAGILHAAFNASGELGFPGDWQFLLALIFLTLTVGALHRYRRRITQPRPSDDAWTHPESSPEPG